MQYKINDRNHPVLQMVGLEISGNVTPIAWYKHIRHDDGETKKNKPHAIAITLLSDIVFWYRPVLIRDERTGKTIGYRKKFESDKLQRSYDSFTDVYGFSKNQVRDGLAFLQDKIGIIDLEFRNPVIGGVKYGNVLFIGLNVSKLREISDEKQDPPILKFQDTPIMKFQETNTESNKNKNKNEETNLRRLVAEDSTPPRQGEDVQSPKKVRRKSDYEIIKSELFDFFCELIGPKAARYLPKEGAARNKTCYIPLLKPYMNQMEVFVPPSVIAETKNDYIYDERAIAETKRIMKEAYQTMVRDGLTVKNVGSIEAAMQTIEARSGHPKPGKSGLLE